MAMALVYPGSPGSLESNLCYHLPELPPEDARVSPGSHGLGCCGNVISSLQASAFSL